MSWIEITKRNNSTEIVSYAELNGWLRENAMHGIIVCYYCEGMSQSKTYEFIDGTNTVPERYKGMTLDSIVL